LKEKEQSHVNTEVDEDDKSVTTTSTITSKKSSKVGTLGGWTATNCLYLTACFFQQEILRDIILLNNQSSVSIFCNSNLVNNIRLVSDTLDLSMNGGILRTYYKADVPNFGEVWL
jgi:hypothetical protein